MPYWRVTDVLLMRSLNSQRMKRSPLCRLLLRVDFFQQCSHFLNARLRNSRNSLELQRASITQELSIARERNQLTNLPCEI